MLVTFFVIETRVSNPLVPMRILLDRNRGASYLVSLIVGIGLFAMFLFLGLYLQVVHRLLADHGRLRVPAVQRRHHRRRRHRQPAAAAGRPEAADGPRPARGRGRPRLALAARVRLELLDARPPGDARHQPRHGVHLHPGVDDGAARHRQGTTPVSGRRCSTPRSRSAARSARRCSTRSRWPPRPPTSRPTAASRPGAQPAALTEGYTRAFLVGAGFLGRGRGRHRVHVHDRQGRRGRGRRGRRPRRPPGLTVARPMGTVTARWPARDVTHGAGVPGGRQATPAGGTGCSRAGRRAAPSWARRAPRCAGTSRP